MSLVHEVQRRLQDRTERIDATKLQEFVTSALRELSTDAPRYVVRELTGDGSNLYPLAGDSGEGVTAAVSGWIQGVSSLREVFYPVDIANGQLNPLDATDWRVIEQIYGSVTLPALWLADTIPSGSAVRVEFSVPRTESDPDLNGKAYEAAADKAAQLAHRAMAAIYTGRSTGTLDADSVDESDRVRFHLDLADEFERSYTKLIGALGSDQTDVGPPAAIVQTRFESKTARGYGYLRRYES